MRHSAFLKGVVRFHYILLLLSMKTYMTNFTPHSSGVEVIQMCDNEQWCLLYQADINSAQTFPVSFFTQK